MSEAGLVKFIGRKGTRTWVAEEGKGNVVGFVLVSDPPFPELVIERLVVDPDYQGDGVEHDLLDKVLEFNAKKAAKSEVTAYVREDDGPRLSMFAELEFKSTLLRRHFGEADGVRFSRP